MLTDNETIVLNEFKNFLCGNRNIVSINWNNVSKAFTNLLRPDNCLYPDIEKSLVKKGYITLGEVHYNDYDIFLTSN